MFNAFFGFRRRRQERDAPAHRRREIPQPEPEPDGCSHLGDAEQTLLLDRQILEDRQRCIQRVRGYICIAKGVIIYVLLRICLWQMARDRRELSTDNMRFLQGVENLSRLPP